MWWIHPEFNRVLAAASRACHASTPWTHEGLWHAGRARSSSGPAAGSTWPVPSPSSPEGARASDVIHRANRRLVGGPHDLVAHLGNDPSASRLSGGRSSSELVGNGFWRPAEDLNPARLDLESCPCPSTRARVAEDGVIETHPMGLGPLAFQARPVTRQVHLPDGGPSRDPSGGGCLPSRSPQLPLLGARRPVPLVPLPEVESGSSSF